MNIDICDNIMITYRYTKQNKQRKKKKKENKSFMHLTFLITVIDHGLILNNVHIIIHRVQ